MFRAVCILTGILVIPFGIAAVIAPVFVFGTFGMVVDPAVAGIVRGYGATALGYGIVFVMLRDSLPGPVTQALLLASVAFNGLEVIIQLPVALGGLANGMIWTTISGHALVAVLSVLCLVRQRAG
jgi:hypothetical protein